MRVLKLAIVSGALALAIFAQPRNLVSVSGGAALSAADGAALFVGKCSICHGKDGVGKPNWKEKGQPDLTDASWQQKHTDAQIADAIVNGKGKVMPAFKGKLSDDEVKAIVAHVRSLKK